VDRENKRKERGKSEGRKRKEESKTKYKDESGLVGGWDEW
jgi:hypothetical protein